MNASALSTIRRWLRVGAVCACVLAVSCTTTTHFSALQPSTVTANVKVGDHVTCVLRDGSRQAFEVTAVEPDRLWARTGPVANSEIVQLDVRRFSGSKTALLTVGVVVLVVGGIIAVLANSNVALMGA